jgi:prepilin-type N-terminal cleavage/methylation domain-containing protein
MIHYKLRHTSLSNESGFTIIESLVAILVVAILLAAIAPVFVISVATRVQAKRIETATDAAKTYIDSLRSEITIIPTPTPTPTPTSTPEKLVEPPDTVPDSVDDISNVDPPALGLSSCNSNKYCSPPNKKLYCMDFDGGGCTIDSNKDLIIQAFRYGGKVTTGGTTTNITDPTKGYQLGLRVYRADGFASAGGDLKKAPCKQLTFTGGLGDRKVPLVEMTTEITKGVSFSDFSTRLAEPYPTPTPKTCS